MLLKFFPLQRCLIPECENETSAKYLEPWLEAAIPPNFNTAAEDDYVPSQCLKYEPKNISRFQCVKSDFKETTVLCDSWVYEDDEWTIVGEVIHFSLVYIFPLSSLSQSI